MTVLDGWQDINVPIRVEAHWETGIRTRDMTVRSFVVIDVEFEDGTSDTWSLPASAARPLIPLLAMGPT